MDSNFISNSTPNSTLFAEPNLRLYPTVVRDLYLLIGVLGALGNAVAIIVIATSASMRKTFTNVLIMNQSCQYTWVWEFLFCVCKSVNLNKALYCIDVYLLASYIVFIIMGEFLNNILTNIKKILHYLVPFIHYLVPFVQYLVLFVQCLANIFSIQCHLFSVQCIFQCLVNVFTIQCHLFTIQCHLFSVQQHQFSVQ